MKNFTFVFVLFFLCFMGNSKAQILDEVFNSPNLPAGWTHEYVNSAENLTTETSSIFGVTPHSGTHMAEFRPGNFGAITKLVTPALNLSGVTHPQLKFYFTNLRIGVVDELRVYYKTSSNGSWMQISPNYNTEHATWTEVVLNLPAPSSTYYIGFEGTFKFGGGLHLDDVSVFEGPACLAPTDLNAKDLTSTSATLTWTEFGSATSWDIEYGISGFTPGTGTSVTASGTPEKGIQGLMANTAYDFYVKSNCGAETSTWSGPKKFTTSCTSIASFPWEEKFEGVTTPGVPACWNVIDNNDDARTFESDDGFGVNGSKAVGIYTDFNNGNNDDYLVLPPFTLNGNQKLSFKSLLLNASQPDEFRVLLSTQQGDVEDFSEVILPLTTVTTAGPNLHTIDLTAYSGTVYIAVHIPDSNTDGYYIYFDDFLMEDIEFICPAVVDVAVEILGNGNAEVQWTTVGTETEWEIEYGPAGFTLGTGTIVQVTGTPNTVLDALNPNTSYDIYVTAVCDATTRSLPSEVLNFQTGSTAGCGHFQIGNNFEEVYVINPDSGYQIADDFIVSSSTLNFTVETITASVVAGGGVNSVEIIFYEDANGKPGNQIGNTISGLIPTEQIQTGMYDGMESWNIKVELPSSITFTNGENNTDATYWIQVGAYSNTSGTPVGIEMTSQNTIGNPAYIRYTGEPWFVNPAGADSVITIEGQCEMTECPEPTNLTATQITQTSARLTWTPGGSETEWEIEYGPVGFELGTGTVVMDNDGELGVNITNLNPSTYYEYYVTPLCATGDPMIAGPAGFSTLCADIVDTFPFVENFENSSGTRNCWTNEYVAGNPTDWKYVSSNGNNSIVPRSGEKMAQFQTFSIGEKTKLVSPEMDLTSLTSPQLTFYFANTEWIGDVDELRVFVKSSANGSWTQIGNAITTEHTTWTQMILDLPNPSAEYYIAFEGKSNYARGMDIDDVMVAEAPTCMQPMNLIATHITYDSVDLSWDSVSTAGNGYTWYIFHEDANPLVDTPFATGSTPEGTTSVTVGGLNILTIYDFYVQANCDDQNGSFLAGPTTFKTADDPLTCGDKFYDTGGPNGNYGNNEFITTIIEPMIPGDPVNVTFNSFDTDFGWDVLYVHNGPDASYPLISSGNGPTPHFPAGGYYGQTIPGPFTSTHSSGALTFVFRSDFGVNRAGWNADVNCEQLNVFDASFDNFSFYPNPVKNTLTLNSKNPIQSIIVHNLLGQEVSKSNPNSINPVVNMGSLQSGVYLMTVTINNTEKTFRLLKK